MSYATPLRGTGQAVPGRRTWLETSKFTMELVCSIPICLLRFFRSRKVPNVYRTTIEADASLPLSALWYPGHALDAAFAFAPQPVAAILRIRSKAKIGYPIVVANAVDVVNLLRRAFAIHV